MSRSTEIESSCLRSLTAGMPDILAWYECYLPACEAQEQSERSETPGCQGGAGKSSRVLASKVRASNHHSGIFQNEHG